MNVRSPGKLRRALSGKNINSKSGLRKRSASLSPKKLGTARRSAEHSVLQVKSIEKAQPFQFFEQSVEDQQAVSSAQNKLCHAGDDKVCTTKEKENIPLDNPNCRFGSKPTQVSNERAPLSRLNADDYGGVPQIHDLPTYADSEHQSENLIEVSGFTTPPRGGKTGTDTAFHSFNTSPRKIETQQGREERTSFSALKVARKLKFED